MTTVICVDCEAVLDEIPDGDYRIRSTGRCDRCSRDIDEAEYEQAAADLEEEWQG